MPHHTHARQALAACGRSAMCVDDRPGHAVTLLRLRLAHLHPEEWVDAVVTGVAADGRIGLRRWMDGAALHVWHHVDRSDLLIPGSVVSVHGRYGVLAAGEHRLNVAPR